MDDGVELKQLTVGVDSVGLGVGAGLASAIVLMAISAASVVIVLIICFWLFGCDCWTAAVAIQEKFALGLGGYFSPRSPGTPGQSSSKKLFVCLRGDRDFPIFSIVPSSSWGCLRTGSIAVQLLRELRCAISVERSDE